MPSPLRLEVFETPDTLDGPALLMPEDIEDIRLNAYERGYVAGWEDGGTQSASDAATRRAAVERQVEQLTFTYHEARGHVLKGLEPLLRAMIDAVLPAAARASVAPVAMEQLMPLALAATETPITLRVGRGSLSAFEDAFEGQPLPPLTLIETDDLDAGQAEFAFGAAETRIDLSHAARAIAEAIGRFYRIQSEETRRA
ncbi:MAG: hypothetical protein H6900_09055 [Rhodobacter sp.]|uniref:hypothetical protein n=1 Tax=Pararhodobacter sp. TaxID=2127056 RepID=UPI001D9DE1B4|nr:hypothetical protein [Pararhodobacter sp.]MCB1343847.1 hypothetical protein [Paracoccaceae bacterium]MCC0073424.1 hypothetical protein [Rhodobacter sp.]HPD92280.1 hypothetical protein [Pararhodobacter sp.]